ncbi:uncharacterized protein LOC136041451 [Artemia franciscana]|uniref:uncharacterized protein LOC136041451 n=1 Tax=Artemia franciscana TaxID=6661 RepID=UPI0032DA9AC5
MTKSLPRLIKCYAMRKHLMISFELSSDRSGLERLPTLTEKFRTDLAKYREKITHNRYVDRRVKSKYESAKDGIELLSLPEEQLAKRLPTESSSLSPAAFQELMSVVREVQREREVLEKEFVSKTVDVKAVFTADEGNIDGILDLVYSKILDQAYGPLQARALENLAKQAKQ